MRGVPWWGVISSAAAPVLLIGGWTVAAGLQPRSFNPVAETISALAAQDAADRWVMTSALLATGACYVTTALALWLAAAPGRLVLITGGTATALVAANPEPAGSGSLPHTICAAAAFVAMALWPALARARGPCVPWGLRPAVCATATALILVLLAWFYTELGAGDRQLGLAERVLAGAQVLWPLAVVLTCTGASLTPEHRLQARPALALTAEPRQTAVPCGGAARRRPRAWRFRWSVLSCPRPGEPDMGPT